MNIKTFRGDSFQDSLDKVYAEFGEGVKILHSREVTESRWFGLCKTRYFEVTAAEPEIEIEPKIKSKQSNPTAQKFAPKQIYDKSIQNNLYRESHSDNRVLINEFNSNGGVNLSNAVEVVPIGCWRRMELGEMNPTLLQRNLLMMLDEVVCFGGPIDFRSGRRITAALVGATGVGKTSTIAKIAAYYKLHESRRVGLLTMDVFRIAAADQLQKYADMLEIQFETASGTDKIQTALRKLSDCELILIDTPGTNPINDAKLRGINSVLREVNVDEVHLLLSATSSLPVMIDTINRFSILNPTGLTLTKLDEAVGISDVYKMLKSNKLPLKFFTLGQNISEDIEVAGSARLVNLYQQQPVNTANAKKDI
ncbi:MAG: hypothetical protein LBJ00_07245 [Planctomycetaceae bacterium]|jgi:flagellar biosynthesis protein FlhF|nr:hypothetical protein [Planctomycetaceae bacterium]